MARETVDTLKPKRKRKKQPPAPSVCFYDNQGDLKRRIQEIIGTNSHISVGEFVKVAVEDRLFDIEQANKKVEREREQRIRISCEVSDIDFDVIAAERVQRAILGEI